MESLSKMKNSKAIPALWLIYFLLCATAGITQESFYAHYTGKLGDGMKVSINLQNIQNKLYGTYYYQVLDGNKVLNQSSLISLYGEYKNAFLSFHEKDHEKSYFEGQLTENGLKGSWNTAGRKIPFEWREAYPSGSIALKTMNLRREKHLTKDGNSPKADFDATIFYPAPSSLIFTSYLSFIKRMLNVDEEKDDLFYLLATYKDNFFDEYVHNNIGKYSGEEVTGLHWTQRLRSHIFFNDEHILSILFTKKVNTGGSIFTEINYSANFDLKTGKEIRLETLFIPGYKEKLKKLLEQKLRSDFQVDPQQSFTDIGFLTNDIPLASNYLLDNNGILFIYNVYALAGNEFGKIEVYLTYDELQSLMKK